MRIKLTRKVAEFIYKNFQSGNMLLPDYVSQNLLEIIDLTKKDEEWIYDNLIESSSKIYTNLIKEIHKLIEEHHPVNRVNILNKTSGYYLSLSRLADKTCTRFRESANSVFLRVLKEGNTKKGVIFEKFCIALLRDLGVKTKPTKMSNDKGVDIFGFIKNDKNDMKYKYVFDSEVLLLCQCKLFSKPVDTPVIRKLVGDSLFIRFSDVDYIELRHNALHLIVFSYSGYTKAAKLFAEENRIKLLDFDAIINISGALPSLEKSRVYRYLHILDQNI